MWAFGNPFGLGHTVARGIVSARERTGGPRNPALPAPQLDAAIDVDDARGSLFHLDGERVGIVTAQVPDTPIGEAVPVFGRRAATGRWTHARRPVRASASPADRPGPW